MARLQMVDDESFGEAVERATGLVAVDFTAPWCPPCRILSRVLEPLAAEYGAQLRVVALDVDTSPRTAGRFGVRSLPTVVFFRDGVELDRFVGAVPAAALRSRIEANLPRAAVES
jgi:thioredoxin 1